MCDRYFAAMSCSKLAAQARRDNMEGTTRCSLDDLGIHPENRGRLGLNKYQLARVVKSIRDDKLSRQRYGTIEAVRVPADAMDDFRKKNKEFLNDTDFPPFSPTMHLAVISGNHCSSALKLYQSGTAKFSDTQAVIRADPNDAILIDHLAHGPYCTIYGEKLYRDKPGLKAIMAEANLDANVCLGPSEVFYVQSEYISGGSICTHIYIDMSQQVS